MSTVLIVGVDGTIGQALEAALAARGDRVIGTTRRRHSPGRGERFALDLADPAAVDASLPQADVAVICAAMARYADCREQPELAHRVNAEAPARIARSMAERGGHTVLLSTSAVFDCQAPLNAADASPAPTSAYGRLKAEAEREVLACFPDASVLRLTKVVGRDMALIRGWIENLGNGVPIEAFSDLTISPLTVEHAVSALLAVADDRGGGIYQASGGGDISYLDIARHLAGRLGADPSLVRGTLAINHGIPENEVARFTSLDASRLAALAGFAPPAPLKVLDDVFGAFWLNHNSSVMQF